MVDRKRKPKAGTIRTEVFAMRFDPKLKYLAEIAARKQKRSLASLIEWFIEQGLENVNISRSGNNTLSVTDEAEKLWALDEPERLINLASNYPDLLTYDEQLFYRVIQEYVINDDESRSTIDFVINRGGSDNALNLHMIRKCWTEIKAFALDSGVEDELKAAMRNYDSYSY